MNKKSYYSKLQEEIMENRFHKRSVNKFISNLEIKMFLILPDYVCKPTLRNKIENTYLNQRSMKVNDIRYLYYLCTKT